MKKNNKGLLQRKKNDNWDTYKLCTCNNMPVFVCLLTSVRMSCRCNIFYRYIFTEVFNKTQRKKEFINSKGRQNRTADISRHCIDQGTFKETIKTQCMHYVRRVISSNIQHIMIEQIYSYKNGYSTFHYKTIFVWQ